MEDTANPEKMPESIGRYKILEGIGFGAMGAVYRAFDPLIKRTLAIKTIRLDIPRHSPQYRSFIERFQHEARISGTLSHSNIVTLFDIGDENGIPFLAMEFVDGQTVAERIEGGRRLKPEHVISLASQIASAIDYAHSKGVIHRDIKPSNLILYEDDRVKVTDFGIAKLADSDMTQAGTLLGTPSYMSPEQAMGDKLDGRTDIFSLGVCCFEMLSGEPPFPGTNMTSILYKLVHVDPVKPANLEMNGLVPKKWHEVFGKVLAKRPDDRYQTATAFVQDLEYCLGGWFGALGTEETISQGGGELVRTVSTPVPPADDQPGTVGMATPPEDDMPATVVMQAVPDDSATAVMKAHFRPPLPAPPPPPVDDISTVVMKPHSAPPPPAPPSPPVDDSATVVMKAHSAPPSPPVDDTSTVVMTAPPGVSVPRDGAGRAFDSPRTVVTKSAPSPSVAPPAKTAGPPAPRDAPPRSAAGAAPSASPRPADEPTVRGQLPPTVKMAAPTTEETVTVRVPPAPSSPTKTQPAIAVPPAPPSVRTPLAAASASADPLATPPPPLPTAEPAIRGHRSGVSPSLVLGGGAMALLFGLLTAWLLLRSGGPPAPEPPARPVPVVESTPAELPTPPPPAVAPTTGTLRVETAPPGALVTVNGQSQGASPLEVSGLAVGDYEVRVELRGHEPRVQKVTISVSEPRANLQLALSRAAPQGGTADFLSTPFGAAVVVDGTPLGQTPVLQQRLKLGSHKVEITKEGHEPWTGTVTVEAGKKAKVDAILRRAERATPAPAPIPEAVDTNRIYNNVPSDVDTLAKRISGSSPSYPQDAAKLKSGESASVIVTFVVNEEGEVTDAKVSESGGSKALDEAVLTAVRKWKYAPALKRGTKIKVRIAQKQTFLAG